MKNKRTAISILGLMTFISAFSGCSGDPEHPGYAYMPDMYYSKAYETYSPNPYLDKSSTAGVPVEGTVPRGHYPYPYENNNEGYELAGKELKNPLSEEELDMDEAKRLYGIYCAICHGTGGEGNGFLVESGKYPPPPSYFTANLIDLPEGQAYHSIYYGKNLMGSYAMQLDHKQRWNLVAYVKSLQMEHKKKNEDKTEEAATASDETSEETEETTGTEEQNEGA